MVKTAQELKRAVNNPDRIKAAQNLFMAMAWVETVRPIVQAYEREILNKHQWHIAREWTDRGLPDKIILDPSQSYELDDTDAATYHAECNEARKAAGLEVESEEYCPLLVAEHEQIKAEWALFDAMKDVTGIDGHDIYNMEQRRKYLDLLLSMFAPLVKTGVEACKQYRQVTP